MSPERQAVLTAINEGNTSVATIAKAVNKPNQTISKLIHKLKNLGVITVDSNRVISINIDNNVDTSTVKKVKYLSTHVDISTLTTRFDAIETQIKLVLERLDKPTNTDNTTRIATLETQNAQLKRDLLTVKNEVSNDLEELELKRTQVEKFKAANEELNQRVEALQASNDRKEKLIEQGHDSFEGLSKEYENTLAQNTQLNQELELKRKPMANFKAANEELNQQVERLQVDYDKQGKELKIALENVDKLATENAGLRSSLEPVEPNQPEPKVKTVAPSEPTKKDNTQIETTKSKFTVEQGHKRFIELCNQYPEKKQIELARILDSEGYKNRHDKTFGSSTIHRWYQKFLKGEKI